MKVLSLFDGMACGAEALRQCGVPVTSYRASEVDRHAMTVAAHNHPHIQHIGDVRGVRDEDCDLLIGGSPCQGFSRAGKGLNFDDPRSALFFEWLRVWRESRPTYWLLENVRMKPEHRDIISDLLGVAPYAIDALSVSACRRSRLYWTNLPYTAIDPVHRAYGDIAEHVDAEPPLGDGFQRFYADVLKGKRRQFNATYPMSSDSEVMCFTARMYASYNGNIVQRTDGLWRPLTKVELCRAHGLPDDYCAPVSRNQTWRMIGNGWSIPVIRGFFNNLPKKPTQGALF